MLLQYFHPTRCILPTYDFASLFKGAARLLMVLYLADECIKLCHRNYLLWYE
jgi:hypothetical protein